MKKCLVVVSILLVFACAKKDFQVLGTWKVVSKYYKATYKIITENDSVKAKVLYYNDGTTILREGDEKTYYVFKNLKQSNAIYVDAISGATKTNAKNSNIELNLTHFDTLEVTTYIKDKPLKEVWVRIKE